MGLAPIEAIEQRDRAMQKLRDLTWACFMWAAGMVAVFGVIAAATLPGATPGNASNQATPDTSNSTSGLFDDDGQIQPPAGGTFRNAGGNPPLVVSGGSR